jgi:hypothetical protein
MEFRDLLDYCKAEAIANALQPTEVSVWRNICRSYSQKFATPLHQCLDGTVDPEEIALAYFEEMLIKFDEDEHLDQIMDQIYYLADPTYERQKEEELDEFMEKAVKDEEERLRLGKPIHKAMKEEVSLTPNEEDKPFEPPQKSGGINLAYLQREEQNQHGNFED